MKLFLVLFIFFCKSEFLFAQNSNYNFILNGKIENQSTGFIKLAYFGKQGKYIVDSVEIINNCFKFRGFIEHPVSADIFGDIISKGTDDINFETIFIEPGNMQISLTKDYFKNCELLGSKAQLEFNLLRNDPATLEIERKIFLFRQAFKKNPTNINFKDSANYLRELLKPVYKKSVENEFNYILNNPCSYISIYKFGVLVNRYTLDSVKTIYSRFCINVKRSIYGKLIEKDIRIIEGGGPGALAKNFVALDINKRKVSLDSYKGKKYILLDFWATWCKPCREEAPFLNTLYDKFKDKNLEIISIANDDERISLWKKVILEDKTNRWVHVLQMVGKPEDIGKKYGVQPIPTKILIDKSGKILLRDESMSNNDLLKAMDYFLRNN